MAVEVLGVLIPIISIIGAFIVVVMLRKFSNLERMSLIERGQSGDLPLLRDLRNASWALRAALLFIGSGFGILIGFFLDEAFRMQEVAYFSMIFIFGGAGLGISYIIEEKKSNSDPSSLR